MTSYENIESLKMPVDNQSWESSESDLFQRLIEELKPKNIIEVGSWKAVSAMQMAELGEACGTHVHCVDTWLGSVEHYIVGKDKLPRDEWGYPKLFHQFLTNVKAAGLQNSITPYPMTSNDGARYFKHLGLTAKLIYIDADHSMEGCYQDINNYWPLLEDGGVMFGDDAFTFPTVFAAALRFTCQQGLDLKTEAPFWIIRKPEKLWPDDYRVDKNHCRDVLQGCYDVPFPSNNPTILDIGANIGAFVRWVDERWPRALIYCYEPHPDNFRLLQRTIDGLFNIEAVAYKVAVNESDGSRDLHLNGTNCGEWSLAVNSATHGEPLRVSCVDAGKLPDADIIKIDAEGAEEMILIRMAAEGKLKRVSFVMLEYHSASSVKTIVDILEKSGLTLMSHDKHMEHRGVLKFGRNK